MYFNRGKIQERLLAVNNTEALQKQIYPEFIQMYKLAYDYAYVQPISIALIFSIIISGYSTNGNSHLIPIIKEQIYEFALALTEDKKIAREASEIVKVKFNS